MVVLGRFSDWATDDMAKSSCHRVNADLFPSSSPRRSFAYWLRANEHATLQVHRFEGFAINRSYFEQHMCSFNINPCQELNLRMISGFLE